MSTLEILTDEAKNWGDDKRYGWLLGPALPLSGVLSIIAVSCGAGLKKLLVVLCEENSRLPSSQIATRSRSLCCTDAPAQLISSRELTARQVQS